MDNRTFDAIEAEIRDATIKYIPNLKIDKITITPCSRSGGNRGNSSYH